MREGKKPIREIRIGDLVLAYNEVSGENGYYPVTDTISHQDPAVVELTIDYETLTTTQEHPFYTLEKGWQAVDELTVGEHIRQADGDYGTVEKIEVVQIPRWMYNLTVDQAHTFYVGDQEWLVHNACNSLGGISNDRVGNNLVRQARAYLNSIPEDLRRVTIGVAEANGKRYVSINGGADLRAISSLRDIIRNQLNVELIIGQGSGAGGHAEQALFKVLSGVEDLRIGISRASGPCPSCSSFFNGSNFSNLFWPLPK